MWIKTRLIFKNVKERINLLIRVCNFTNISIIFIKSILSALSNVKIVWTFLNVSFSGIRVDFVQPNTLNIEKLDYVEYITLGYTKKKRNSLQYAFFNMK